MKRMTVLFLLTERFTDLAREGRIAWYGRRLLQARSRARRRFYWQRMAAEIGARSPRQVARMEAAMGLAVRHAHNATAVTEMLRPQRNKNVTRAADSVRNFEMLRPSARAREANGR